MAENKTKQRKASVTAYMKTVLPEKRRTDGMLLIEMFKKITKEEPRMWGPSMIGFGKYQHTYDSGHKYEAAHAAFAPRKASHSIYISGDWDRYKDLLPKLGKFKRSKSCCLYVTKLDDIDMKVLEKLMKRSYAYCKKVYGSAD